MLARLRGLFALTVTLSLIVAACGGGDDPTATSRPAPTAAPAPTTAPVATATPVPDRYGGTLRLASRVEPAAMDVQKEPDFSQHPFILPALNWVLQTTPEGLQPDLADSWQIDGTRVTFKLNPKATWHDGFAVTADDLIYSVTRIATEGQISKSYAAFESTEKIDTNTFAINLSRTSVSFVSLLGIVRSPVYPQHVPTEDYATKQKGKIIGSGPFIFENYARGVQVSLERNPNYWKTDDLGNQLPYLDRLEIAIVPDVAARYALYRTGRTDIVNDIRTFKGKEQQVKEDVPDTVLTLNDSVWIGFVMNTQRPPYDDVRVRKAISLAIDRQAMSQLLTDGLGTPFRGYITPGSIYAHPESEIRTWPGYNPDTKQADIQEAKRLLAEAGVVPSELEHSILMLSGAGYIGEAVQGHLRTVLGVNWKLEEIERATAIQRATDREFSLYNTPYGGLLPDPVGEMEPFMRSGARLFHANDSDASVDARLDELDTITDQARRIELSRSLEKEVILDRVWQVILSGRAAATGWRGYVQGAIAFVHGADPRVNHFATVWLDNKS